MKLYRHKEGETLKASSLRYGLLREIRGKTVKREEAKFIDQRTFGPAYAAGLIGFDGTVFFLSESGDAWLKSFEGKSAWKETESRDFSHLVKFHRTRLHLIKRSAAKAVSA